MGEHEPLFAPGRQLPVAERGRNVLAIPGEGEVEVDGRDQRILHLQQLSLESGTDHGWTLAWDLGWDG